MVVEARNRTLYVSGSVRGDLWPVIRSAARVAGDGLPAPVLVDLSGIRSISGDGLRTLVSALDEIEALDLPIVLLNLPVRDPQICWPDLHQRIINRSEKWWQRLMGTS